MSMGVPVRENTKITIIRHRKFGPVAFQVIRETYDVGLQMAPYCFHKTGTRSITRRRLVWA